MTEESPDLSNSSLRDLLGVDGVQRGSSAGYRGLERVFSVASRTHSPARFLRLATPTKFRSDVIAIADNAGKSVTDGFAMLLDSNIPEIEFLLVNPFSMPFLARLDAEKKCNWDIRRVQEEVLEFARGLLSASHQRRIRGLGPIRIAFHRTHLIWNIDIAGDEYVVARAYYKAATGHDSGVAEVHLKTDCSSHLAESFISYYNYVRSDARTVFVQSDHELQSIGTWPSLFKGNAVLNPSDTSDRFVEKSCNSTICDDAEVAWLSLGGKELSNSSYFNPTTLARRLTRTEPWRGKTSCIHRIDGIPVSEFLWHLQRIGDLHPHLISRLEWLAGSLTSQSFQALQEFRRIGETVDRLKSQMQPYPWIPKLKQAIGEAGRLVTYDQEVLSGCVDDLLQLGRNLESQASVPFRDAHLKNRLISLDDNWQTNDYANFCQKLEGVPEMTLLEWLRRSTYDIDFETSLWLTTKWDDLLHILWSDCLGFFQTKDSGGMLELLRTWRCAPTTPSDERLMWTTLLCRSLREYCRRLWYDRVMPQTYSFRYRIEHRNHFLELARAAADGIDGYSDIKRFLDLCNDQRDRIWRTATVEESRRPVVAKPPVLDVEILTLSRVRSIFISYSHEDVEFVTMLRNRLEASGEKVWLDEDGLIAGDIVKQIRRAIWEKDVVIIVLSKASLESRWVAFELEAALDKEWEKRVCTTCPVALDDTWKKVTKTTPILTEMKNKKVILDFSQWNAGGFDAAFDRMLRGIQQNYGPEGRDD